MSTLTKAELDKLDVMYAGDKDRDATSKIRGFLYQDYITIMCLLQDKVECVCSEYLEDVDVFYTDGIFEFIQVKHYPKTTPNLKEILTDLYFQNLRLDMLGSSLKSKPRLYIHGKGKVVKPDLDDVKKYVNLGTPPRQSVQYPSDPEDWLRKNVYTTNKKQHQKDSLFNTMSSVDTITSFYNKLEIENKKGITGYKEDLMAKLAEVYPDPNEEGDEENWKTLLLGLAISYIQRRYTLENPTFDELKVDKKIFDDYMKGSSQTKTDKTIASYLVGAVCEEQEYIRSENEDLSDLQTQMLDLIVHHTIQWIQKLGQTPAGQYQLVNTFTLGDMKKLQGFEARSVEERLGTIQECKDAMIGALDYLWKIMLNLCQDKVNTAEDMMKFPELFDPVSYMDPSVKEYVCFDFPQDRASKYAVILPPVGSKEKVARKRIVERMLKTSQKPQKWFFKNSKIRGKDYYNRNVADVRDEATVADINYDSFYVECMDCIGVDENEWCDKDCNGDCIFLDKCVKGGK